MSLFTPIRNFVRRVYGDLTPDEMIINHPYATATTPDMIVAAAIVQSFVKDFEDWTISFPHWEESSVHWNNEVPDKGPRLENVKKALVVQFHINPTGERDNWHYYEVGNCSVGEVPLDTKASNLIKREWISLERQVKKAKEVAAKAKAEMERNEAAWNLAEKLLGMKRNEFGALVPIKTVEE